MADFLSLYLRCRESWREFRNFRRETELLARGRIKRRCAVGFVHPCRVLPTKKNDHQNGESIKRSNCAIISNRLLQSLHDEPPLKIRLSLYWIVGVSLPTAGWACIFPLQDGRLFPLRDGRVSFHYRMGVSRPIQDEPVSFHYRMCTSRSTTGYARLVPLQDMHVSFHYRICTSRFTARWACLVPLRDDYISIRRRMGMIR